MEQEAFTRAIQDGIREGVKSRLAASYNNPIDKMIDGALGEHMAACKALLSAGMASAIEDPEFREQIAGQVRHKLANILVARFGGELEKQVNLLKSDPATRARITLAIEEIVKERSAATV